MRYADNTISMGFVIPKVDDKSFSPLDIFLSLLGYEGSPRIESKRSKCKVWVKREIDEYVGDGYPKTAAVRTIGVTCHCYGYPPEEVSHPYFATTRLWIRTGQDCRFKKGDK